MDENNRHPFAYICILMAYLHYFSWHMRWHRHPLLHSNRIMAIVLINAHDKERIDKTCCVDNHHCDQQDKHSFKVPIARHMGIVSFGAPLLYGFQSTFHF